MSLIIIHKNNLYILSDRYLFLIYSFPHKYDDDGPYNHLFVVQDIFSDMDVCTIIYCRHYQYEDSDKGSAYTNASVQPKTRAESRFDLTSC